MFSGGCSIPICVISPKSNGNVVLPKRKFEVIRRVFSISSNPPERPPLTPMPLCRKRIDDWGSSMAEIKIRTISSSNKQQLTRQVIVIIDQKSNTFLLPGGHRTRRGFSIKSSLSSEQCFACSTKALRFIERSFAHQRDERRRLKRDDWSPWRGIHEAFTLRLSRKNVVECIWNEHEQDELPEWKSSLDLLHPISSKYVATSPRTRRRSGIEA